MNKYYLFVVLMFSVMQLVGCAGNVQPQSPPEVIEKSQQVSKPEIKTPEVPVEAPVITPVIPQAPVPVPAANSNAVASLAQQARAQYAAKNYQGAIATAERGLRIDRRSPELYLLLAQSYVQMANTTLALQFAQQGIRYAQAGSEVLQSLNGVRETLVK